MWRCGLPSHLQLDPLPSSAAAYSTPPEKSRAACSGFGGGTARLIDSWSTSAGRPVRRPAGKQGWASRAAAVWHSSALSRANAHIRLGQVLGTHTKSIGRLSCDRTVERDEREVGSRGQSPAVRLLGVGRASGRDVLHDFETRERRLGAGRSEDGPASRRLPGAAHLGQRLAAPQCRPDSFGGRIAALAEERPYQTHARTHVCLPGRPTPSRRCSPLIRELLASQQPASSSFDS
jgi:hypothetical protein